MDEWNGRDGNVLCSILDGKTFISPEHPGNFANFRPAYGSFDMGNAAEDIPIPTASHKSVTQQKISRLAVPYAYFECDAK